MTAMTNTQRDDAQDGSILLILCAIAALVSVTETALSKDPLFVNSAGHDYHLRSTAGRWDPAAIAGSGGWVQDSQHSPAIDSADPTGPFNLEPAPNGGRANLGVDGNTRHASRSAP